MTSLNRDSLERTMFTFFVYSPSVPLLSRFKDTIESTPVIGPIETNVKEEIGNSH